MKVNIKLILAISVGLLFWASAFVGIRAELGPFSAGGLALARYVFASSTMFIVYCIGQKQKRLPQGTQWLQLIALGFIGITLYNVFLNLGEMTVPAGIAGFIIAQSPAMVVILSFLFLGERLTHLGLLGLVLCMIGILLIGISESHFGHVDFGVFYILVGTLSGALYTVIQKPLLKTLSPIEVASWMIWFGTLFLIIFAPSAWSQWQAATITSRWVMVYLGIFPAAISYVCWSYVISKLPASRAASFLYILPFLSTFMAWLILDEIPKLLSLVGGLLAIFGVVVVRVKPQRLNVPSSAD